MRRGRRKSCSSVAGCVEQGSQHRDRAVVVATRPPQRKAAILRIVPGVVGDHLARCVEPGDIGYAVNRILRARAGSSGDRSTACRWRSVTMRAGEGREALALRAVQQAPVDPRRLVVLAVGIVVAVLRAAELVAAQQHGRALRQEQRREHRPLQPLPHVEDGGVLGRSLHAPVGGVVVGVAVLVVLAVGLVVALDVARPRRAA